MKRTQIAAIDVGSTKICTIIADMNGNEDPRILGFGVTASQGLEKGAVVNNKETAASISQSVRKAGKMAGCKLKSAYVSIPGTSTNSLNNRGVISIPNNDELVHAADKKRALEIAQSVEVPSDQKLLHVIPRSYTLDGQHNINNPVGMYGFRLDVETHIITTNATSVRDLVKCLTSLGVCTDGLVLTSLASAEAVLTEDERHNHNGVVLADIGGATTDVAIFKNGSVYHTFTLPVGGQHVTNDIAIGLGISTELAEEMKKKYGDVTPVRERVSTNTTITENEHGVSHYDLCQIIQARIEELFRLILFKVQDIDYTNASPARMVLTGGTCNLPGIAELGCDVTRLPVRIGVPLNIDSDNEALRDPAYATSVGLLYWKMRNEHSQEGGISRRGLQVLLPRWLSYFNSKNKYSVMGQRR
jgi:cell division protein FtsA